MSSPRVAVVGAGPAGMAAAVEAGRAGAHVTIVDAAATWGGQYWRHRGADLSADRDLHHDIETFDELDRALHQLRRDGRLTYRAQHQVWAVRADTDGCAVHAVDRTGKPVERSVAADRLVLATGAYDRPVPFPGWDLPGVMTAGGAQALLKGHGVLAGRRVVVAGTGPFLLPVAAGLAARGATVIGVHEANHPMHWLRHPRAIAGAASKLGEAAGYAATLARYRIPVRHGSIVVAAHGDGQLERVTVARLDGAGRIRPGTRRELTADVLAIGYGFATQSELPQQAGAVLHVTADRTLAVSTDDEQRTSNPRVFAAGEATGVGGAQLAIVEGRIAGRAAAGGAPIPDLVRHRDRLRRFAAAMHAVYPVPTAWLTGLHADTLVCRCEEVTVAEIDAALALGARDTRTVKLLSRAGMGWCQGRECAFATGCLIAHRTGQPPDPSNGADRPVAAPVPLGAVAESTTEGS